MAPDAAPHLVFCTLLLVLTDLICEVVAATHAAQAVCFLHGLILNVLILVAALLALHRDDLVLAICGRKLAGAVAFGACRVVDVHLVVAVRLGADAVLFAVPHLGNSGCLFLYATGRADMNFVWDAATINACHCGSNPLSRPTKRQE